MKRLREVKTIEDLIEYIIYKLVAISFAKEIDKQVMEKYISNAKKGLAG